MSNWILALVLMMGAVSPSFAVEMQSRLSKSVSTKKTQTQNVPPKKSTPESGRQIDFRGMQIQGELKNPGDFYFEHRSQEKFDSLVKRRANFHREMLRDAVLTR